MKKKIFPLILFLFGTALFMPKAFSDSKTVTIEIAEDATFSSLKENDLTGAQANELFLQGYFQALIDAHFPENRVEAKVKNGRIELNNLPDNPEIRQNIILYVTKLAKSKPVDMEKPNAQQTAQTTHRKNEGKDCEKKCKVKKQGIWMPQSTILFPTQIANPRQISFSCGWRFNDDVCGKNTTPVSFGDQFPLHRWCNVGPFEGDLQLDLEAGVFAVFNQDKPSSPLINADYYVAFPLSYAFDKWAFRFRLYHISSHLGDEYIVNHAGVERLNPSFEAIDLWASYQLTDAIRVYGGPGFVLESDKSYKMKRFYFEGGLELRLFRKNFVKLYAQPFFAMHFRNWADHDHHFDSTYALGYEWGKIQGIGRKVRLYFEFHKGYSLEGQFSRRNSDYLTLKLAYGF